MLYLVGLGLHDEQDISLRGLQVLKGAEKIYAEFYTNFFSGSLKGIEALVGKKIEILKRQDIEEHAEENLLKDSKEKRVVLLVPGDPMVATTHSDIILRAKKLGIETRIIHASSIYSAVAETGLQIYKFGRTTSLVFPEKSYFPTTPYEALKENLERGLHTLFLLDIKLTIAQGIQILLKIEKEKKQDVFEEKTLCVGIARLGGDNSAIRTGTARELMKFDFGSPPHALIVPGKLHFIEEEMLALYRN